ncbi:MAG: lamin tail domain-containing protein, partial [Myxococcales bacterium]|nr:lamin tail domain-containing protein [Myxococcales bacterium]
VQLDPTSSWVLHNTLSSLPYSPGKCSDGADFPNCGSGTVVEGDPDADGGGGDVALTCDPAGANDLVLNEILADPPAGSDPNGDGTASTSDDEFVEVVNVAGKDVALTNVEIDVGGKKVGLGNMCLPANGARVLFHLDGLPTLTNSGGTVSLLVDGSVVQAHTYGSEGGKDESLTLAVQLDPTSSWVGHTTVGGAPYSPGKCSNGNAFPDCFTTPVEEMPDAADGSDGDDADTSIVDTMTPDDDAGPTCGPPAGVGDLVINEIMADPGTTIDWNGDGNASSTQDEYVEILNLAPYTVSLVGVTISDATGVKFTAGTHGDDCLAPNEALVVFGGGTPTLSLTGAMAVTGGSLSLNNTNETVTLKSAAGASMDTYSYTSATKETAFVRNPDGTGTSFSLHPEVTTGGLKGSPGTCLTGAAFPGCLTQ